MLMKRARAHSSSCSQVVLVYVYPFDCNSPFCSRKSQKITENPLFYDSRSFKVDDVNTTKKQATSASYNKSTFMSICKRFHTKQANGGKITTY